MTNYLAQFQTIKSSCDRLVIAIEDVSDLWPEVKSSFEEHQPLKRAILNNKNQNPVFVENLPVEFILTTDARLRSRFPQEQSLFCFREPYASVVLVTCEDLDEFKNILKPRLKLIVQNDEREWFIVFVSRAHPSNDQATKSVDKVYAKLEVEFSSKKRERCCKLDIHGSEAKFWENLELKMTECIRNTLDRRVQFYEDEIHKLSEQRFMPIWNFCNVFILKESLGLIFEMAHLHEEALREYDELELCYLEIVNLPGKQMEFGGLDDGDDRAALLKPGHKPLTQIVQDDSFREFEFRQYLFACQSRLLFKLNRPFEVASRGYTFVICFAKALTLRESILPFCMCEVWVITACLGLIDATASHYNGENVASDIEKEFYRVLGDLYSLSRVKFMRLGYLIGYGVDMERCPLNSACLSMLPWPNPVVWPSLSPNASSEVLEKEKMILQETSRTKHFGIQRKPLPLEPSTLLRVANRRRASLSTGNMPELVDRRPCFVDGSGLDASPRTSSPINIQANGVSRSNSAPRNTNNPLDRPMRLAEIFVAAEHALRRTISDHDLLKSLSSRQDFEKKYLDLTKGAAEHYHRSWWKRHGVVLDGEIAAICFKHGNYDLAAKSYEKVCALYSGEGWEDLLAVFLPDLAECQKILDDQAGYLSSCVKLLSLDKSLFSLKERQTFQSEVASLAHSEMKNPVPLDVSSLITFAGNPGAPLQYCDGDTGTLPVTVWSGFPDDITLESLSLTLVATNNADEGGQALTSSAPTVLKPGKNTTTFTVPPQKPGSYVLGVLTGQIGHLRFRSHGFAKGGPVESDDFMGYEKPTRPILKVSNPRPLVDLAVAISSALLLNEAQWIGIIVRPIDYSLKGASLHIDTGPGLKIEESYGIEMERYVDRDCEAEMSNNEAAAKNSPDPLKKDYELINLCDGKIELPQWASNMNSILWVPVRALGGKLARGSSSVNPLRQDILEGMRTIALKLKFGICYNQIFDRTIAIHFTDPFHVSTRVADKCNNGTFVLQVMLHSLVKANLVVNDAWLDLQNGFERPTSTFFPVVVSPGSRAGLLFSLCLRKTVMSTDGKEVQQSESVLNIKYRIHGNRADGAHEPVDAATDDTGGQELVFRSVIALQRPVLDPCLVVAFLSLPDGLRVGQLISMQWRVERLKNLDGSKAAEHKDELLYEVNANSENWMIAGRKRGHIALPMEQGSRIVISVLCVPLVTGYVRPPQLRLPNVDQANVSAYPAGPHLICVLPPVLSSSFCVPN